MVFVDWGFRRWRDFWLVASGRKDFGDVYDYTPFTGEWKSSRLPLQIDSDDDSGSLSSGTSMHLGHSRYGAQFHAVPEDSGVSAKGSVEGLEEEDYNHQAQVCDEWDEEVTNHEEWEEEVMTHPPEIQVKLGFFGHFC